MKVIGLTSFIADINKYKEDTIGKIKGVIEDTAKDIEIEARRDAPTFLVKADGTYGNTNLGIGQMIDTVFLDRGLTAKVGIQGEEPLPAYMEFGTGLSAKEILAPYPDWVKKIAMEFYVNGRGTLRGKPFLYPAVLKAQLQFEKDIKEVLDENRKI